MSPASVGFRLDTEVMLAAAESIRTGDEFWSGFMDFLWNRPGEENAIPLRAEYSVSQLEFVLNDIADRFIHVGNFLFSIYLKFCHFTPSSTILISSSVKP